MSKKLMLAVISKMHINLNHIIESKDFNLLNDEVQKYSRRLDRAITHYNRLLDAGYGKNFLKQAMEF